MFRIFDVDMLDFNNYEMSETSVLVETEHTILCSRMACVQKTIGQAYIILNMAEDAILFNEAAAQFIFLETNFFFLNA